MDGRSLAELYMPETIPSNLKLVHSKLDELIDRIYGFSNYDDSKKLKILLERYADMRGDA